MARKFFCSFFGGGGERRGEARWQRRNCALHRLRGPGGVCRGACVLGLARRLRWGRPGADGDLGGCPPLLAWHGWLAQADLLGEVPRLERGGGEDLIAGHRALLLWSVSFLAGSTPAKGGGRVGRGWGKGAAAQGGCQLVLPHSAWERRLNWRLGLWPRQSCARESRGGSWQAAQGVL